MLKPLKSSPLCFSCKNKHITTLLMIHHIYLLSTNLKTWTEKKIHRDHVHEYSFKIHKYAPTQMLIHHARDHHGTGDMKKSEVSWYNLSVIIEWDVRAYTFFRASFFCEGGTNLFSLAAFFNPSSTYSITESSGASMLHHKTIRIASACLLPLILVLYQLDCTLLQVPKKCQCTTASLMLIYRKTKTTDHSY